MRNIFFLLVICTSAFSWLPAQDSIREPRHIVKMNVLSPIFSHLEGGYEHMLLKGRASAGITLSAYNHSRRENWYWSWRRLVGAGLGFQFRIYGRSPFRLEKKLRTWTRGLYLSPEFRVNRAEGDYITQDYVINLVQARREIFTEYFAGLNAGIEFAIARRFVVDLFAGLGMNGLLAGDLNDTGFWRDLTYPGYEGLKPRGGLRVGLAF